MQVRCIIDTQTPTFLAVFMTLAASAFAANEFNRQVGQRLEKVRTTAYTYGAAENGPGPNSNAIGKPLRSGKVSSAAADWSRWPLGTRFRVLVANTLLTTPAAQTRLIYSSQTTGR
jgi:3D (Asp-Asp-Asp) domain-containing protein